MIYSAAKNNPDLSLSWARDPDVGLPRPDVVVFLDLDEESAEKRGGYGEEKYEKKEMQKEVKRLFGVVRERQEESLAVVDAGASVDKVAEQVLKIGRSKVDEARSGKLGVAVGKVSQLEIRR